ncbi:hypothetical protein RB298_20165 [Priestia sp. BR_2]
MPNFLRTERYMKISLITLLLLVMCSSPAALASWAYSFVVNDGKIYVMSENPVEASALGDGHQGLDCRRADPVDR